MTKKVKVDQETGDIVQLPFVHTQMTAMKREKQYEKNSEPSMTVPGQTMTVAEMVERHRRGLPIDKSKGALYQGDELLPNIDNMDLIDRQAYMDSVADALVEVKARIQETVKDKKEQAVLDRIDQAVREKLAEISKPKSISDAEEIK